jgi:hypothetical protein
MNDKTFNTFTATSDIVVIGVNPESADYTNPQGNLYGFASYVRASNDYGDTRIFHVTTSALEREAMDAAEQLAKALTARFQNLGKLPVGFDAWTQGRAVYGSDAYLNYGQDDQLSWEREIDAHH